MSVRTAAECVCWFVVSRSVSNDVDDDADQDVESGKKVMKKPSAEKVAPVKLVPAPPPKENIWEKCNILTHHSNNASTPAQDFILFKI